MGWSVGYIQAFLPMFPKLIDLDEVTSEHKRNALSTDGVSWYTGATTSSKTLSGKTSLPFPGWRETEQLQI
jgi:hypothetical protein